MTTYVLRVCAAGEEPNGHPGIELLQVTTTPDNQSVATSCASHPTGASADPLVRRGGAEVDLRTILSAEYVGDEKEIKRAGEDLYERLALGDVGVALATLPRESRVLLDLRSQSLQVIPWELVCRGIYRPFSTPAQSWSRGSEEAVVAAPGLAPVDDNPVLRVVVVVGSPRADETLADQELCDLEDLLHRYQGRVIVRVLVRPRAENIVSALVRVQPHIFHFSGHGKIVDGEPVLRVYSDELGAVESWDGGRLVGALQRGAVPRLVVLNACDTAAPAQSWGLTKAFLDAGVNAVVGMQGKIDGDAAKLFSRRMYESLIDGNAIDKAFADARNFLAVSDGASRVQWPIPRLEVRGDPDRLLPAWRAPNGKPKIIAPVDFVGRFEERLKAWETLCPLRGAATRLVVVRGVAESGKSELVKLLGETWVRTWDYQAIYVRLDGASTSSGNGERGCAEHLLARTAAALADVGLDPTRIRLLDASLATDDLCMALRAALEAVVPQGKRLLILLDGLEAWQPNLVQDLIVSGLVAAYASADDSSRVRMVFVEPPALTPHLRWESHEIEPVVVDGFSRADWSRAAPQFIRFHGRSIAEEAKRIYFERRAFATAGMQGSDNQLDEPGASFAVARLSMIRQQRKW